MSKPKKSKKYYENNKGNLKKQPLNWYKNLSEEEKREKQNTEKLDLKIYLEKIKKN